MSTATLERPAVLDEQVFRQAWADLHPQIVAYLRTRVPAAVAEDIAQETFLRAWNARHTYQPGRGDLRAWIYTIASRLVVDHFGAARRPQTVTDTPPEAAGPDVADVAAGLADTAAAMLRVRHALAHLSLRQQQVIVARHLLDLSVTDTAIRLRIPHIRTVKSLTARALAALRTALAALPDVVPATAPPLPQLPAALPDPARTALATTTPPTPERLRSARVSAHRLRRRRSPVRCGRLHRVGGPLVVDGTSGPPGTAGPAGPGELDGRHRRRRPDTRWLGGTSVEETGGLAGTRHPRRPAGAHRPGHQPPSGSGTAVNFDWMTLGWMIGIICAAAVFFAACVWFWILQDPGAGRHRTDLVDQLRETSDRRRANLVESLTALWDAYREKHPAASVAPQEPGIEAEATVRITREQMAPLAQQAQPGRAEERARRRGGRHWRRHR